MISISDNADADAFAEAVRNGEVVYSFKQPNEDNSVSFGYKGIKGAAVEAVWGKPVTFCECASYDGKSVKGVKLGWYVHATCGKPRAGAMQHPRDLSRGLDVPVTQIPYYLGFRADSKGWRLTKEDVDGTP
jgi:hypothetical protein